MQLLLMVKVMQGRRKKREGWVRYIYDFLDLEFELFTELCIKVTGRILMDVAICALQRSNSPVRTDDVHPVTRKLYRDMIT